MDEIEGHKVLRFFDGKDIVPKEDLTKKLVPYDTGFNKEIYAITPGPVYRVWQDKVERM